MKKIKEFMTAFKKAAHVNSAKWVEWIHEQMGKTYCDTCLKLDKCWFLEDNKPKLPQHFFCHCRVVPLDYNQVVSEVKAESDYSKLIHICLTRKITINTKNKKHLKAGDIP